MFFIRYPETLKKFHVLINYSDLLHLDIPQQYLFEICVSSALCLDSVELTRANNEVWAKAKFQNSYIKRDFLL